MGGWIDVRAGLRIALHNQKWSNYTDLELRVVLPSKCLKFEWLWFLENNSSVLRHIFLQNVSKIQIIFFRISETLCVWERNTQNFEFQTSLHYRHPNFRHWLWRLNISDRQISEDGRFEEVGRAGGHRDQWDGGEWGRWRRRGRRWRWRWRKGRNCLRNGRGS